MYAFIYVYYDCLYVYYTWIYEHMNFLLFMGYFGEKGSFQRGTC